MKAITIRNIPSEVQGLIRKRMRLKRLSASHAILDLLGEQIGQPIKYHDLDDLAGSWSDEEARAFDQTLAFQRCINEKLWS